MSRWTIVLVGSLCLASLVLRKTASALTYPYTFSGVTYTVVEPDPFLSGGTPGNTVRINNPTQFWAQRQVPPVNADGLWDSRDFSNFWWNQPAGAAQSDPDLVEIGGQDVIPPDLRTTISGLPNNTYDVYLAFLVEPYRLDNPISPATLGADLDVGQAQPTTLRGGHFQPGLILAGDPPGSLGYELAFAPLGQVTATEIKVLVGPMWAGDLNRDGINNQDDLNIVLSHYGQLVTPGDRSMGDTDSNGAINQGDITNVTYEAWGEKGYPPGRRGDYIGIAYVPVGSGAGALAGVPEPASVALIVVGAIAILTGRSRRGKKLVAASIVIAFIMGSMPLAANAAINGSFVQLTSEGGTSPPAGKVSQDLTVNATTDWLASELRIVITSGGAPIYQDFNGGVPNPTYAAPDPGLFGTYPTLRWDTYVTGSAGVAGAFAKSAGGAVDIGGTNNISTGGDFDSTKVNLEWFTTDTSDIGTFTLGRFTLNNTAQGTWILRLDAKDQISPFLLSGNVQNGLLVASLSGDYNSNGKVDAADYVVWRKSPANFGGTPGGYNTWRGNFGAPPGSGSGLLGASTVPEPAGFTFVILAVTTVYARLRVRRSITIDREMNHREEH